MSGIVEVALIRAYTGGCLDEGQSIGQTNIGVVNVNIVYFFCPGGGQAHCCLLI
ncbi:hypothetical protein [Bacillus sp. B15-48]|uniref:hypothetical protein n=1 Tax=Bacillus sp. B15-48 TaxID=1548601 RepID=UPI00193F5733|nr:hypothetical protein [Bacillus sp. B15-48]MBM4764830.1 hypothetical protein [Bacillus sp. B15-48]